MFFLITIGIIAGFVSGLITGMVIYSRINRKMYGNVENNLKISMHDFIEAENKNLLNTSTVAFRNALEIERNERENTGLKLNSLIEPLKDSLKTDIYFSRKDLSSCSFICSKYPLRGTFESTTIVLLFGNFIIISGLFNPSSEATCSMKSQ